MERYICLHGHFYQPPRENPWLEGIELQDSAYPYHDWNERITAECYEPNGMARMLDELGQIVKISSNYGMISFNFGPTLLAWMEQNAPQVYRQIIEADKESRQRFSGHGSAIAQAYNHSIMPLANRRDKYTQIVWGIKDFEQRFGRSPEGMWLPETAVDLETLDILAERGILYTILAPHQAGLVREQGEQEWQDVGGGRIDPTRSYSLSLPSGRSISLFFYDGPISRAVAFEGLLNKGEYLAHRLLGAFSDEREHAQLVHIATDGETYGHHHRYGEMALAYALHYLQANQLAKITNYGEYLALYPPTHEVQIIENTSWSCAHMIERWRSDCGCNSGGYPGWSQDWRTPLREALDWLRDTLSASYEEGGKTLLKDPWKARNEYISVLLNRSTDNVERFIGKHAARKLDNEERIELLKLLELQRQLLLMYTSCGWFFDELSGLETVQVMQYAGRAVQLAREVFGHDIEPEFLQQLERARSNIPEYKNGRTVYEKFVMPSMIDLPRVGAHYAMSSLFEDYPQHSKIYSYQVDHKDYHLFESGKARLAIGRSRITSTITWESSEFSFGVLHFGEHNLTGGVRMFQGERLYATMIEEVTAAFERADLPEVLRLLDKHFIELTYSLKSLFRDQQRNILDRILSNTLADTDTIYRQLYENHAPLMRFLTDMGIPLPRGFQVASEFALNTELCQEIEAAEPDMRRITTLLNEARRAGVALNTYTLSFAFKQALNQWIQQLQAQPSDLSLMQKLVGLVKLAQSMPFPVDFWKSQNIYYELLKGPYTKFLRQADQGNELAQSWIGHFTLLGKHLGVAIA